MIKTKLYFHKHETELLKKPIWLKSHHNSSIPKVNSKEINIRTFQYKHKKIIQYQQPQELQFWGLIDPIQDLPCKTKTDQRSNIIKHRFNRSQVLLTKYINRKQFKSNQKIQIPTTISIKQVQGTKTSRNSFNIKKRKLSTRLPSTTMSQTQLCDTQEFFCKFDEKCPQQKEVDLFKGIVQIINMKSQKKYIQVSNKKQKKFRKYSQGEALRDKLNSQEAQVEL